MTISVWLDDATVQLTRARITTPRLDAEVLLCHMLGVDRAWLVAHADDSLTMSALSQKGGARRSGLKDYGEKLILGRLKRQPIAYLVGHKEFYGRDFIVDKHVLIPRPESETLIELLKSLPREAQETILDVGTGSGALAITAKLELPASTVIASDISPDALEVARRNAKKLKAAITYVESEMLTFLPSSDYPLPTTIIANLPYVDRSWDRSPETEHEPSLALFARDGGLELIYELLDQAPATLAPHGYLLLEADPEQHETIVEYAKADFGLVEMRNYAVLLQKTS